MNNPNPLDQDGRPLCFEARIERPPAPVMLEERGALYKVALQVEEEIYRAWVQGLKGKPVMVCIIPAPDNEGAAEILTQRMVGFIATMTEQMPIVATMPPLSPQAARREQKRREAEAKAAQEAEKETGGDSEAKAEPETDTREGRTVGQWQAALNGAVWQRLIYHTHIGNHPDCRAFIGATASDKEAHAALKGFFGVDSMKNVSLDQSSACPESIQKLLTAAWRHVYGELCREYGEIVPAEIGPDYQDAE